MTTAVQKPVRFRGRGLPTPPVLTPPPPPAQPMPAPDEDEKPSEKQIRSYKNLRRDFAMQGSNLDMLLNVKTDAKGEPQFISKNQAVCVINKAIGFKRIIRAPYPVAIVRRAMSDAVKNDSAPAAEAA